MANQSIAPKGGNKPQPFSVVVNSDGYKSLINRTLGDPKVAQRFVASITSAVAINPLLQECTPDTIIATGLLGESLGLSPSPQLGQYYMVPFNDRKNGRKVATFQLGYRGYIQLAIRSGYYLDIDAIEVRAGEYLGRDPHTGKPLFRFVDDEAAREKLDIIGYLAYYELLTGFRKVVYFSYEKMLNHADRYSQAFKRKDYEKLLAGKVSPEDMWKYSSPWYSGFNDMALKTVLRQLLSKWGVLSIELKEAIAKDTAALKTDGTTEFVDVADSSDYVADESVATTTVPESAPVASDDPFAAGAPTGSEA